MSHLNVTFLSVEFIFNDVDIKFEFFIKASEAWLLQRDEIINMDQVVAKSHLILLLGFVQVTIKHLKNGVFGVNLSVVILLENLNFFFKLLCLCQS